MDWDMTRAEWIVKSLSAAEVKPGEQHKTKNAVTSNRLTM
jgi:hypothetical protein